MTTNSMKRYSLYFAPRESDDLWRLGSEWLGRCAISGDALKQPAVPGVDAEAFAALTSAPRRYGFHATLKAPFRLAEGKAPHTLLSELRGWCATQVPFPMPRLVVRMVDDFLALVPEDPNQRLDSIAAECVKRFDRFRAPLSDTELARRNPQHLSEHAAGLLDLWGYPFVMDLFRFHFSLTGGLPEDAALRDSLRKAADARFGPAAASSPTFDSVCVFEESAPGADFRLIERAHFVG